ncbi:glycoside hydrolase family 13 protein [Phormidium sp. LEGE 05292]|uniref:glycoside hydrolase family 13 protein n=1 Tax=[Phormidium] sp. LEGE 05292 TaxID=767427 RepID=UPI0018814996|nr:glycoside hydrolase family 13 protein [Phormidium sp. LEGE 05292]MBE9226069.1 glycoside hydrolase family 13 protein [Phormidium sp. LEGE 05292]
MKDQFPQLPEFIFGPLSTSQGRLKQARMERIGLFHDVTLRAIDPTENEPILITVRVGAEIAVKSVSLHYTTDTSALLSSLDFEHPSIVTLPMQRTQIEWDTLQWCYLEHWEATIPGQAQGTQVSYLITATTITNQTIASPYVDVDALKQSSNAEDFDFKALEKLYRNNKPQIYQFVVDGEKIPAWIGEAIIYQIFVDRFAPDPGTAFHTPDDRSCIYGGTLNGILSKLDYLQDLGVNCLWLTPIFPSPSHHGYDPIDHSTIEPRLGTMEDWQNLISQAHQRGIRIILDYVVNHVSDKHSAFQTALSDRLHPSYEWFRFRDHPLEYDCFFDVPGQPEVNSDNPGVREYFIEHACYWLQQGCDGFRLDYAHGVTHAFWSMFRDATRRTKSDSVTLGEITQPPSVMRSYTGRMDGCLDFRLLELLRGFFVFENLSVSQFDRALEQHLAYFGSSLVLPSFLDNHDMNRFLWVVDGDKRRLKLAALCQFTLPNPPIIYYGTEVGLSQLENVGRLEESRLPMLWGAEQDTSLLEFYKQLIALRRKTPELWQQPRQSWLLDDVNRVYGYECGEYAIVLNAHTQKFTLSLSDRWKQPQPILTTDSTTLWNSHTNQIALAPFAGVVLQKPDDRHG